MPKREIGAVERQKGITYMERRQWGTAATKTLRWRAERRTAADSAAHCSWSFKRNNKNRKNVKEKLEWMQKNQHRSARTIINKFNLPLLSMSMEKSWHGTLSLRAPRLNGGWLLIKKKNVKCYLNLLWLKPRAIFAWETARSKTMDLLGGKVRWRLASTGFVAVRREWFEFNRYRRRIDDVETI